MTCDLCGKNDAAVHLTEVINDQTRELHLCETCAHEKGAAAAEQFGLAGLLAGLTEAGLKTGLRAGENPKCARCEMTYEDFRKNGRLGCGVCYESFRKYLTPLLRRIHGSAQYTGVLVPPALKRGKKAAPAKKGERAATLLRLKEQLREAISAERFEEAVRLRDKIRAMEKKPARKAPKRKKRSVKAGGGKS
ncbi:MAG: UvrB/UvrC motif-containing protein [Candidatus Omnitrophica bacterium]|nr:UvrB/UvrC motif-containing protein [Candidatus Omnitrophota bacterium]